MKKGLRYLWRLTARKLGLGTFHGESQPSNGPRLRALVRGVVLLPTPGGNRRGVIADGDSRSMATKLSTPRSACNTGGGPGRYELRRVSRADALGHSEARRDGGALSE